MKLYSGSNTAIRQVYFARCKPFKHFGQATDKQLNLPLNLPDSAILSLGAYGEKRIKYL